jgi:hypothetical protein
MFVRLDIVLEAVTWDWRQRVGHAVTTLARVRSCLLECIKDLTYSKYIGDPTDSYENNPAVKARSSTSNT